MISMPECVLELGTQKRFEPVHFYVHLKGKNIKLANRLLNIKTVIFGTFCEDTVKFFTVKTCGPPEIITLHL